MSMAMAMLWDRYISMLLLTIIMCQTASVKLIASKRQLIYIYNSVALSVCPCDCHGSLIVLTL